MSGFFTRRAALVGATAALACLPVLGSVQAAGLLDFLFGPSRPAPQQYEAQPSYRGEYDARPLQMTVRPRRERSERVREVREPRETKPKLVTPIDSVARPHWYLEDPTLRRGDIVVLKDKVLVFNGGRGGALEDFTALDKSKLVSQGMRTHVGQMAGLRRVTRAADLAAEPVATGLKAKRVRAAKRSRSATYGSRSRYDGGWTRQATAFFD